MRKVTKVLKKHITFIIVFTMIIELLLAAFVFVFMPDRYEATTTLLVSNQTDGVSSDTYDLDSKLVGNYRAICTSERVLAKALRTVGIGLTTDELKQRVSVSSIGGTNLVNISVWSNNGYNAAALSNALAEALSEEVMSLLKLDNMHVVDYAKAPEAPSRTHIVILLLCGLGGGILFACVIVLIINYFDDTLRTPEQVSNLFGKPVLGQIPHGVTRLRRR